MYLVERQVDERNSAKMANDINIAAVCWLTNEVRTASYARYLNATLYNIHYLSNRFAFIAPFKYIPQCLKTWSVLFRQAPDAVYVMNPPVFAALSVYFYCLVSGKPFIMDTHSPSLYARKWKWSVPLQRWLAKRALVNIVDQERFRSLFEQWGASSVVLERPPLDIAALLDRSEAQHSPVTESSDNNAIGLDESISGVSSLATKNDPFHITLIGKFAGDEPVDVVIDAARELPDVFFSILGDRNHAPRHLISTAPSNVIFTGYLSGQDYWNHLASVDAVMTLTTFKYSLLGGAQEGLAMGKPLILSKQPVLTEYFCKGTVFIEHDVPSIIKGVRVAQDKAQKLGEESADLAKEKRLHWEASFEMLQQIIERKVLGH